MKPKHPLKIDADSSEASLALIRKPDPRNPFSHAYYLDARRRFLSSTTMEEVTQGDFAFRLVQTPPNIVLQDFLNEYQVAGVLIIPTILERDAIWMSITRMEVQSMWVPLQLATGKVGTSGLGLGYFPIEAARKPDVTAVHVYEISADVIQMFDKIHCHLPSEVRAKIHLHHKNALHVADEEFDFFFADHFQTACAEDAPSEAKAILDANSCREFRFWTEERFLLEATRAGWARRYAWSNTEREFFGYWTASGLDSLHFPHMDVGDYEEYLDYRKHRTKRKDLVMGALRRKRIKQG